MRALIPHLRHDVTAGKNDTKQKKLRRGIRLVLVWGANVDLAAPAPGGSAKKMSGGNP